MGTRAMTIFTEGVRNYRVYRSMDGYPELLFFGRACGMLLELLELREHLSAQDESADLEAAVTEWIETHPLTRDKEGIAHRFGICQCPGPYRDHNHWADFRYTVDLSNPAFWLVKAEELAPWAVRRAGRVAIRLRGVLRERKYRLNDRGIFPKDGRGFGHWWWEWPQNRKRKVTLGT